MAPLTPATKRKTMARQIEGRYRVMRIVPINDPVAERTAWHAVFAMLLEAANRPDEEQSA
jgi:hypothetical protein